MYISVSLYHYLVNEQSWDFPWQRCRYFSTPLWLDKIGDENCSRQIIIMKTHATQVYHIYTQQASGVLRRGSACEHIAVGVLMLRQSEVRSREFRNKSGALFSTWYPYQTHHKVKAGEVSFAQLSIRFETWHRARQCWAIVTDVKENESSWHLSLKWVSEGYPQKMCVIVYWNDPRFVSIDRSPHERRKKPNKNNNKKTKTKHSSCLYILSVIQF